MTPSTMGSTGIGSRRPSVLRAPGPVKRRPRGIPREVYEALRRRPDVPPRDLDEFAALIKLR